MALKFKELEDDIYACIQCGYCRVACPTYEQFGWESVNPRGKVFYLKRLMNRNPIEWLFGFDVDLTREMVENIYKCTICGYCEEVCHVNIKFIDFWEEVREMLVKEKIAPLDAHKVILERIKKLKNPYNELTEKRGDWFPKEIKTYENAEVIFFAGCTESYRKQDLAQLSTRILDRANVKFSIFGKDEWCCGSPLIRTGQKEYVEEEIIEHNVKEVEKRGAKIMITACSGCYNTIRKDYTKIYGKLPFRLYHISQYLEMLLKENKLKIYPLKKKVTYHDPCHLGRHAKEFNAPRNVIRALGCELVEMKRIKELSRCCGAGGGFKSAFNDYAENIGLERVKEAKETNAEVIITACPFCHVNLNAGAKKGNIQLKTIDLVELVWKGMEMPEAKETRNPKDAVCD